MPRICQVAAATLMVALQSSSLAVEFSIIGSDHTRVKGSVIVDIGDVQEVPPPAGADWKEQVYALNSRCFTLFGYFGYWGYGAKPAMFVVDESEIVQLAILETSLGGVNLKLHFVQLLHCPEHANIIPSCDGLSSDECTKLLDEHQRKLERKLKDLGG